MSKNIYKNFFYNVPEAVFVINSSGGIVEINDSACDLFGFSRAELLDKNILDIKSGDNEDEPLLNINTLKRDGKIKRFLKFKNGKRKKLDFLLRVIKVDEDRYIGHCQDVSEKKNFEERYKRLFNNMINGFAYHKLIVDDSGRPIDYIFLDVNRPFEKITGLKKESIIGKRVTDVLPGIEKDPADWIGVYGEVARTGKAKHFDQFSEPMSKWFRITAYSDEPGFFSVLVRDTSEERKKQEVMRLLSSFPEENPNPVVQVSRGGKIIYRNEVALKIFDKKLGIGDKVEEAWRELVNDAIEKQYISRGERKVGNSYFSYAIAPQRDKKNANIYALDITDRIQAEKNIEKSAKEWSAIFDSMSDGITLQNKEGQIIAVNKSMCDLLNKKKEEIIGLVCNELFACKESDIKKCPVKNSGKKAEKFERYDEKLKKWLTITASNIYSENQRSEKKIHVVRDITDRKKTEKEIENRNRELERFNSLMIGREEKMIELKNKIRELEAKLGSDNNK